MDIRRVGVVCSSLPCCFIAQSLLLVVIGILNCSVDNCMLAEEGLERVDGLTT